MNGRRRAQCAAAWALALAAMVGGVGPAVASSPGSADDRTAQVQAMLDRVLGPGGSVVEIAATVRTGGGTTSSVAWGRALPSSITGFRVRTPIGTTSGSAQVDAVGRTSTVLAEQPGALLRQTVAVAVDRRAMAGVPLGRLRRLVAAAAGLSRSRGDRLLVVVTTFARPAAAAAPARTWTDDLVPLAVPAIEFGGGVIALLLLAAAFGGARRSRPRPPGRS